MRELTEFVGTQRVPREGQKDDAILFREWELTEDEFLGERPTAFLCPWIAKDISHSPRETARCFSSEPGNSQSSLGFAALKKSNWVDSSATYPATSGRERSTNLISWHLFTREEEAEASSSLG